MDGAAPADRGIASRTAKIAGQRQKAENGWQAREKIKWIGAEREQH